MLATIVFAVMARMVLSAKLDLDARPRIPERPDLDPGACAVVQLEAPQHLIAAIKDLRALTGWNLRNAKMAIDGEYVVSGVSLEAAERVVALLETHGGRAKIVERPDAVEHPGRAADAGVAVQSKPTTSSRCPYCHEVAGEDGEPAVACTACLARHHQGCWDEHKQCAGCGHTERYAGVEQTEGRAKPRPDGQKDRA